MTGNVYNSNDHQIRPERDCPRFHQVLVAKMKTYSYAFEGGRLAVYVNNKLVSSVAVDEEVDGEVLAGMLNQMPELGQAFLPEWCFDEDEEPGVDP